MRTTLGRPRMEPDVEDPPVRGWRDWVFAAGVAGTAIAEAVVRDDLLWRPDAVALGMTFALTMLGRRTRPLAMVGLGCGAFVVVDLAAFFVAGEPFYLYAGAVIVVLVYAPFRWGTGREEEVAVAVARGLSNAEIADELHISLSTVKFHLAGLMTKIGARNRVQIAIWAYETRRVRP